MRFLVHTNTHAHTAGKNVKSIGMDVRDVGIFFKKEYQRGCGIIKEDKNTPPKFVQKRFKKGGRV